MKRIVSVFGNPLVNISEQNGNNGSLFWLPLLFRRFNVDASSIMGNESNKT
jgi:hypothetical protein